MSARNTLRSFGTVTRALHWLTALVILTALPLGLIANRLPYDTAAALALKAQVFSVHKTLGVAAFLLGAARLLWAVMERHPVPLHPQRRGEMLLAGLVHWLLYGSLVVVPLSGWVHHAALTGFAPILWPFGQGLPFVPQSEAVAAAAGALHWVFTKLLGLAILLHVAGALKHHLIDHDATLLRMLRGTIAPDKAAPVQRGVAPLLLALAVFAVGVASAGLLTERSVAPAAAVPVPTATAGNWTVDSGTLAISVRQMGAEVSGQFASFTADINFDAVAVAGRHGQVTVTVDIASLTLGAVTKPALEAEFFDVAAYPTATFTAELLPRTGGQMGGYLAKGILTLRGLDRQVSLPFTLDIDGDTVRMTGTVTLDRRDFGIGASYADEASVGFAVEVTVTLVARRS